jgi:hypothetical protein
MYLRKIDGPRAVKLPDGTMLTRADLPPTRRPAAGWPAARRWWSRRSRHGLISMKEALDRYALSEEEFEAWRRAVHHHGLNALKVTALQKYRQP